MSSLNWDDIRVAYTVAESGSLSAAGQLLGMTHSTVLRRVNQLEQQLGQRLFIRHQRGYRLTEAGHLLLDKGKPLVADIQMLQNSLMMLGSSPSGTLRISTVSDFSQSLAPLLAGFRQQYPQIRVETIATDERVSLTRGDVHAALRIGSQPTEPDLIARPLIKVGLSYYATECYIERFGLPQSLADVGRHLWLLPTGEKREIAAIKAVYEKLDDEQIIFQSNSFNDIYYAVLQGMGIGSFESLHRPGLMNDSQVGNKVRRVDFGLNFEAEPIWLVYHKDMKDSVRIRALQEYLVRALPELAGQ
ncbi:LysR family transcriptional regulator [Bacterioplanoides sp.]|uniref:LysR family transcriptional regulator n=1 Tax=Bacterioplanoides sp. TaxID=2066072 RepID=UPI003B5AAEE7